MSTGGGGEPPVTCSRRWELAEGRALRAGLADLCHPPQLPFGEGPSGQRQHPFMEIGREPEQRHHLSDPRAGEPLPPGQGRLALDLAGVDLRPVSPSPLELGSSAHRSSLNA